MHPFPRAVLGLTAATLVCVSLNDEANAGTWPEPPAAHWHGYSWFDTNGFPVPVDDFPVQIVLLGEPPPDLTVDEVGDVARSAAEAWSSVPCASARIEYAGHRPTLADLAPGEIPFHFADPTITSCFPRQTIGWTAVPCPGEFPDKTVFLNIKDYDWSIEPHPFQPAYTDPNADERLLIDVESVLTHEFGHVLGLSHSQDPLATMYASYRGDGGQRTLAVDDKLGVCSLYAVSNPPDECTSGRDCRSRERCDLVEGMRMCRELRGDVGDACALDRLVCEDTCALPDDPRDFGYCTMSCGEAADRCPEGFRCTQELLVESEAHCERVGSPDEPTCSATEVDGRAPLRWWWVLVAAGLLVSRRRTTRARAPRAPLGSQRSTCRAFRQERSR